MATDLWSRLEPFLAFDRPVLLALSGGADSSVLLAALVKAGQKVAAATYSSILHPPAETEMARKLAQRLNVWHFVVDEDPLLDPAFKANPPDRCYWCKRRRLAGLKELAQAEGFEVLVDGGNLSDHSQYRPGLKAAQEFGVISPFSLAGLTKAQVKTLGRELGLEEWLRPPSGCLATRVAYHQPLTEELLRAVGQAEVHTAKTLGLEPGAFRVRVHGNLARIEIPLEVWGRLPEAPVRSDLAAFLGGLGFEFVTLDLVPFASGRWDRHLDPDKTAGRRP